MADRIVVIDDGRILLDGTPDYVFEQEKILRKCGLAVPQGTELIHKLREAGMSLDGKCVTLEECIELIASELKKQ